MKPVHRRQLPSRLYNLSLVECDDNDSIVVFCSDVVRPTYAPLFDANDRLVGIFYSTMAGCIFSRRSEISKWPRDRLFLDRAKVIRYFQTHDVFAILVALNEKSANLIDPTRDARPIWHRPQWNVDLKLSNVDRWVCAVDERVNLLKSGKARAMGMDGKDNMAFFGIVLSAIACLVDGSDADLFYQLGRMDELIDLEALTWLKSNLNYAYGFDVGYADSISNYPYKDWLKETIVVRVNVPEHLHLFGKSNLPPCHMGKTYVGIKAFRSIAQRNFVVEWKKWAVAIFRRLGDVIDPALSEFMSRTRLWKVNPQSKALVESTPDLIFPMISPLAPLCLQKLFSATGGRNLKHYARWQLAELAVDMNWSKFSVLNAVKPEYRSEISAAMEGYRRKGTTKNRCKIYMRSTDLCPYSTETFRQCCGEVKDIEDLWPGKSFQYRLMA